MTFFCSFSRIFRSQSDGGRTATAEARENGAFHGLWDTLPEVLSNARRFANGTSTPPAPPSASMASTGAGFVGDLVGTSTTGRQRRG